MEENMNEEALTADGQKDDDIDYVEDREELTEERIKDMLDQCTDGFRTGRDHGGNVS